MVFFVNNSGVITNSFPEQVFEGSANANSFYVVAPFANNLTATVAFTLPNGIVTQPYGLTATGEISGFTDGSGNTYYGWSMELPNAVTTYYGKVIAQVAFYSANRLLCTSATTFTVGRGVAAELPETPTEDVYQQILQALAELQSDLGNGYFVARAVYVWNSAYTYGAGELVYYPMGTYGVYVKSNVANNTQEPYTDGAINSNWTLALDFNAVMGVLSSAEDAAASAEAAANSASAAATSRAIAEQAATSASGSASAAAASESNAESAADRAEAAAQENEAALDDYYDKTEIDSGYAKTVETTMDNTTYVVTVTLKAANGTVLSTSSVDLPLESVVVSGSYNSATQSIDLVLQNGSTVSIPVGDLVDGLASQTALDNVINGTTPVAKATNADNATTADTADKVQNALTLVVDGDTQTYDGSSPISIELNTQSNTDPEAVHYTAQTLTSEQQAQARSNIGAQASGNYALQDGTYPNLNTPKTLYNLGAYDTYTSNGDGTATITRKTGYTVNEDGTTTQSELDTALQYTEKVIENQPLNTLPQDGEQWVRSEWEKGLNLIDYASRKLNVELSNTTGKELNNSSYDTSDFIPADPNTTYSFSGITYLGAYMYDESKEFISVTLNVNTFTTASNCAYLRFALTKTDTTPMLNKGSHSYSYVPYNGEIVRTGQDGEQWVREEWEKGLNLCAGYHSTLNMGNNHHMVAIGTYPAGTYYLQITGGTSAWLYLGDTYYNENPKPNGLITSGFSFTLTEETTLNIDWYGYDVSGTNYTVMLNKGSHPYPYQPYNGEIVRTGTDETITGAKTFTQNVTISKRYPQLQLIDEQGRRTLLEVQEETGELNLIRRLSADDNVNDYAIQFLATSGVVALQTGDARPIQLNAESNNEANIAYGYNDTNDNGLLYVNYRGANDTIQGYRFCDGKGAAVMADIHGKNIYDNEMRVYSPNNPQPLRIATQVSGSNIDGGAAPSFSLSSGDYSKSMLVFVAKESNNNSTPFTSATVLPASVFGSSNTVVGVYRDGANMQLNVTRSGTTISIARRDTYFANYLWVYEIY